MPQYAKARSPISVTPSGMTKVSREKHPLNALEEIVLTLEGRVIVFKEAQELNA